MTMPSQSDPVRLLDSSARGNRSGGNHPQAQKPLTLSPKIERERLPTRPLVRSGSDEQTWPLTEHYTYLSLDRALKANLARLTLGLTPAGLAVQGFDWLAHLAFSPGKQIQLCEKGFRAASRLISYTAEAATTSDAPPCISPQPQDRRFQGDAWTRWPYNLLYQSFLLTEQWWHNATNGVDGLSKRHERGISFLVRQMLDTASPSNFVWTNPEVARATLETGGRNLIDGLRNLVQDWQNAASGNRPIGAEKFVVGENVAVTPGKVIFENRLIELLQYAPATQQVHAEPVLIVPAWIMKYYILDLSPHNSLVKFLVDRGHTVFMISWKNPTSEDRDLGMDDYRRLGIMSAFDAVSAIVPDRKLHAMGYCLGGTLLLITAAAMARDGDGRLGSMTLLAAQGDFTEAGELGLFITESEISYLENMMWDNGYLDTHQMAGAFQLLHSNDLIWSRVIREYLLGRRLPMNDLMAWNSDGTRLPYRMHSEYLRRLFLANDFAEGRYEVDGRPVWITDIRVPTFVVGTVTDHVAPWRSVYKIHLDPTREVTFVLTSGGHNAGIVSELGHPGRSYQIATREPGGLYVDPATWRAETPVRDGSWWPEWLQWLVRHSTERIAPPRMGTPEKGYRPVRDAPGLYVRQP